MKANGSCRLNIDPRAIVMVLFAEGDCQWLWRFFCRRAGHRLFERQQEDHGDREDQIS